ncbi:hypothetical protein [Maricaulis sp. CAU 1757]
MYEALNGLAERNALGAFFVLIIRAVAVALGLLLIALSVPVAILTPFPFVPIGAFVGLLGLILVAGASKTLHRKITNGLRRFPWIWKRVRFAFGEKEGEPAE